MLIPLLLVLAAASDDTNTMQALRIHEFGPAQVLKLERAPRVLAVVARQKDGQ